jgi:hypothetical protein
MTEFDNEFETDPRPDEQISAEGQVREFILSPAHIDFEQNEANKERLLDYLDAHSLPITAASLHLAYTELKQEGILELAQPKEPIPASAPAPVVQTPPEVLTPAPSKHVMYRNGQRIEGTAWKW